jgi:phosphoglycolate phosphatase
VGSIQNYSKPKNLTKTKRQPVQKPDSLIFDMDGTLWDAVDTYTGSWNLMFKKLNLGRTIQREQLLERIGWEGAKVMAVTLPEFDEEQRTEIYEEVNMLRRQLLAQNGGILYDGVMEGLQQLATKYRLFILSNCGAGIIRVFIDWAGIDALITDEIAYGVNKMPKHHNIKLLVDNHQLKAPVYIGDTAGDGEQSRKAGVPFVFVSYGFGTTDVYDLKFDDFNALTSYFMGL